MLSDDSFVGGTQACALTGFSNNTLRKWANAGKIEVIRTPNNVRRYSVRALRAIAGGKETAPVLPTAAGTEPRESIVYCRVSTAAQRDNLDRQVELMRTKYPDCRVVTDVGSGLNFRRKGLRSILELCLARRVQVLRVSHRDRLCRFAFDLLEWILNKHGCEIAVEDDPDGAPTNELTEDLLSVITVFTARHNGAKSYKRALEKVEGAPQDKRPRAC
jgi:putative resolvase